ncbi:hypothetical protein Taro_022268 [Colocasia esculenta]|uniref:Uncharacterized protein n=1 Tax=Colocasia esculenta TaxID=4460 RepID=A0A843V168_COLES|nr:hypothetical protein [Colocasia esculenta]
MVVSTLPLQEIKNKILTVPVDSQGVPVDSHCQVTPPGFWKHGPVDSLKHGCRQFFSVVLWERTRPSTTLGKDWNKVSAGNKVLAVLVDSQEVPVDKCYFPISRNAILTVSVDSQGGPIDSHCQVTPPWFWKHGPVDSLKHGCRQI